ncbi:hypothetical protein EJ08DRAFT_484784 [Tothia fuscella]|uniref:Uncharacterized protein n=1 Tax=Tothia fuscella TaxID=1048955 RepID=A0A9P4NIG2_9PEZI|nr:hypothetical protein EJ08DRAFT_484784 [Tothia fuscella]
MIIISITATDANGRKIRSKTLGTGIGWHFKDLRAAFLLRNLIEMSGDQLDHWMNNGLKIQILQKFFRLEINSVLSIRTEFDTMMQSMENIDGVLNKARAWAMKPALKGNAKPITLSEARQNMLPLDTLPKLTANLALTLAHDFPIKSKKGMKNVGLFSRPKPGSGQAAFEDRLECSLGFIMVLFRDLFQNSKHGYTHMKLWGSNEFVPRRLVAQAVESASLRVVPQSSSSDRPTVNSEVADRVNPDKRPMPKRLAKVN